MLELALELSKSKCGERVSYHGTICEMFPQDLQLIAELHDDGEDGYTTDGSAQRDYEQKAPRTNWYLQKKIYREIRMNHKSWSESEKKLEDYLRKMEPTTSDQQFIASTEQESDAAESESSEEEYGKKKKKKIKKAADKKDEKK
jgi:hypothetical protein